MQLTEIWKNKKKELTSNLSSDNLQHIRSQVKIKLSKNATTSQRSIVYHQPDNQSNRVHRKRQAIQVNNDQMKNKKIDMQPKKTPQFLKSQFKKSPEKQKQSNKKQLGKPVVNFETFRKLKHTENKQKQFCMISSIKTGKNGISSLQSSTINKPSFLKKKSTPQTVASEKFLIYKSNNFSYVEQQQICNKSTERANQDIQKHYNNSKKVIFKKNLKDNKLDLLLDEKNRNIVQAHQPLSNDQRRAKRYPQLKKGNSNNVQNKPYSLLTQVVQRDQIICPQIIQQQVFASQKTSRQVNTNLERMNSNSMRPTKSLILEDQDHNYLFGTLKKTKSPVNMSSVFREAEKINRETARFQLKYSQRNQKDSSLVPVNVEQRVLVISDFIKIKNLGKGRYGQVFLARQKRSGFIYAIKKLNKRIITEQGTQDQVIRELKLQSFLNHPNIIKMYGFFSDQSNIYIILEPALQGQFYQFLQKKKVLSQAKSANYLRQICSALAQLHQKKILHRDIKPQNIVMHQNILKLCDFGWSVYHGNEMRATFCGTPLYVCPEILKGSFYDQKVDVWSLGVMAYEMIIGENPFNIKTENQLVKILKQQFCIPNKAIISKQCQQILQRLLKKNPQERPTIFQLQKSSFFKRYPDKNAQRQKMFGFF